MSRRRQTPWLHRRSRIAIGAIAIFGMINTSYLTITKLLGGAAACPAGGCDQVLTSDYAYVFGVPLSLFGLLAYTAVAALALGPLLVNPEKDKLLRNKLEDLTWLLLFIATTAMLVFSAYLMYIMFSQFVAVYGTGSICPYCVSSAIFALTLFILTILGRSWDDVGQLFFTGIIVSVVVLVGAVGVYANVGNDQPATASAGNTMPPITTTSGAAEIALARHLKDIGAKMYGAYWCPHCHDQKQLFGQPAVQEFPYIECAADGANSQLQLCQAAGIEGFPSWEINGQIYPGARRLSELAELSGYQGPRDFRY
jgi:uncharacterized membrane protein/glutaredoxin